MTQRTSEKKYRAKFRPMVFDILNAPRGLERLTTPAITIPVPTSATFSIQIVDGLEGADM